MCQGEASISFGRKALSLVEIPYGNQLKSVGILPGSHALIAENKAFVPTIQQIIPLDDRTPAGG